jgi:hypothetical protein
MAEHGCMTLNGIECQTLLGSYSLQSPSKIMVDTAGLVWLPGYCIDL